jgi:DNA-binding winged helix-turn-helix (wHTH) protein
MSSVKRKIRAPGAESTVEAAPPGTEVLALGGVRVDVARREVLVDGAVVELGPKVYELLLVLLREPGRVHTREALFERLWPGAVLLDVNLTNAISVLRRALDDDFRVALRTVPKVGYALDARVRRLEAVATPDRAPAALDAPRDAVDSAADRASRPGSSRSRSALLAALALVALAAGLVAWHGASDAPRPLVEIGRVSSSGDAAWVPTALREALADALRRHPLLRVSDGDALSGIGAPSMLDHESTGLRIDLDVADAGPPGRLNVTATARGPGGAKAWQQVHVARPDELLVVAAAIAEAVRRHQDLPEAPAERAAAVPEDAVRRYLQALELRERHRFAEARVELTEALRLAPEFALAELTLARTLESVGYEQLAAAHFKRLADPGGGAPEETRLTAQARAAALSRDWPTALRLLDQLVRDYPDEPAHRILRAFCAVEFEPRGGPRRDAAVDALAVLDDDPPSIRARADVMRARAALRAGEPEAAIARADAAAQRATEAAAWGVAGDAWGVRAAAQHDRRRTAEAMESARQAQAMYARGGLPLLQHALRLDELNYAAAQSHEVRAAQVSELRAFIERAADLGAVHLQGFAELSLGRVMIASEDPAAAAVAAGRAIELLVDSGDADRANEARELRAVADLLRGDSSSARTALREVDANWAADDARRWRMELLATDIDAAEGRTAEALAGARSVLSRRRADASVAGIASCAVLRHAIEAARLDAAHATIDDCRAATARYPGLVVQHAGFVALAAAGGDPRALADARQAARIAFESTPDPVHRNRFAVALAVEAVRRADWPAWEATAERIDEPLLCRGERDECLRLRVARIAALAYGGGDRDAARARLAGVLAEPYGTGEPARVATLLHLDLADPRSAAERRVEALAVADAAEAAGALRTAQLARRLAAALASDDARTAAPGAWWREPSPWPETLEAATAMR